MVLSVVLLVKLLAMYSMLIICYFSASLLALRFFSATEILR